MELIPICGFCGNICHDHWYVERERKNQHNENLKKFSLCHKCYELERFPSVYIKTDFRKILLNNVISDIEKKHKKWPLEKSLNLIKKLKEVNNNIIEL